MDAQKGGYRSMNIAAVTLIAVALRISTGALYAQADSKRGTDPAQKTVTVTGCLSQAEGRGVTKQFLIKDGQMSYEVVPDNVNLAVHLGHKVTVSGTSMKGEGPHDDDRIRVSKLTMVSATCP
jgi:hypothetical protein